jgi:hypothetical protein
MRLGRASPRSIGCAADVSCVIAIRLDEDDAPLYEIRLTLNGEIFYELLKCEAAWTVGATRFTCSSASPCSSEVDARSSNRNSAARSAARVLRLIASAGRSR